MGYFTDLNIQIIKNEFYTEFQRIQDSTLNKLNKDDKEKNTLLFSSYYSGKIDIWISFTALLYKSSQIFVYLLLFESAFISSDILSTIINPLSIITLNSYLLILLNKGLVINETIISNKKDKMLYFKHREKLVPFIDDLLLFYKELTSIDLNSKDSINLESFTETYVSEAITNGIGFSAGALDIKKLEYYTQDNFIQFIVSVITLGGNEKSMKYINNIISELAILLDIKNISFNIILGNDIIRDEIKQLCIDNGISNNIFN